MTVRRALISVSDKTGLAGFARFLQERGVEILSTGGTAKALAGEGIAVTEVSDHTGFPEIMDGRVKTLHPKIHGGILAVRDDAAHQAALRDHAIAPIDLVVINLYPFEAAVAQGADAATCVENIDIGGPAMIRSAAKNHACVTVVVDPADYAPVMEEMSSGGAVSAQMRRRLAARAFSRTAAYDSAIAGWMNEQIPTDFPLSLTVSGALKHVLHYGENPHQKAAFYVTDPAAPSLATARQAQGAALSYNNYNDAGAAFDLACEFDRPAVAIIKHANPCGVALGDTIAEAFALALACDPVSAYGGIIAANRPLDAAFCERLGFLFLEVIIAPNADEAALAALAPRKKLKLLLTGAMPPPKPRRVIRSISGGFLCQEEDRAVLRTPPETVTRKAPDAAQLRDLIFAFTVAKHVKSNAIVLARGEATIGIGAGQMSRIDSTRIACWKAKEAGLSTQGAALASDAFFPFADNVEMAAQAGVAAIIQPGGSIRDAEVIACADARGLVMAFTGIRHFRH